jgi:alpha-amylase
MSRRRRCAVSVFVLLVVTATAPTFAEANKPSRADPLALLAQDALRAPVTREHFYFVMADRFQNADKSNDVGGLSGPREVTGYDPTRKGWYHGGDLKGIIQELDYIRGLGTTAIWLTPSFKNKPVQGLDSPFPSAGYHGYWVTDFTQIDPHLGTNAELAALVDAAHARGMKVYFDIITNHTADVITYEQKPGGPAPYDYVPKSSVPYRDASGTPFDDRDFAGGSTFPPLDEDVSFPLKPVTTPEEADVKVPEWLNDKTLYHNRGNTTFSGENSLYGDFFGLDDLFTEHPQVVKGMEEIYDTWIKDFKIDGYRIDTMKHVNLEFWQQFAPHILQTAHGAGIGHFYAFGEVAEEFSNPFLSRFTTKGKAQGVLDFTFFRRGREFAGQSRPTKEMAQKFLEDDWFIDADSNAYNLPTFLGNHDNGHIGMFIRNDNPGAPESELLKRDILGHELMYLSRGNPVVYFGDEQGFTGAGNDQSARQDMFPSQDPQYNNQSDPGVENDDKPGENDNIGSDVTPMADNFDPSHPLYRRISELARLTQRRPALRDGVHQMRYSADEAGLLAFSRTDADQGLEYLVVLNNSETAKTARIETYSSRMPFWRIYGEGSWRVKSSWDRRVRVTVPALSAVVYRAAHRLKKSRQAPGVTVRVAGEVAQRPEVAAEVRGSSLYEVTFAVREAGSSNWTNLGTDDSSPYRVFPDVTGYPAGTRLEYAAVVRDNRGNTSSDTATTTVGASEGAGTATIHYIRPDGNLADWGVHLWGDAIADGIGAGDWCNPIDPVSISGNEATFVIALADDAASLNFILHKPCGDEVPTTREVGGDRAFIPATAREVWIYAGDPAVYTEPR